MMMKLLPLVAQAIAERRFLAAKASDARYYGETKEKTDLIFDKDVKDADVDPSHVQFYAEGATKIFDKTSQNCLLAASASTKAKDGGEAPTAAEQLRRRQPKTADGTAVWELEQSDNVPSCDNTFYNSKDASELKAGQNPKENPSGGAEEDFTVSINHTSIAQGDMVDNNYLLYFCKDNATDCSKSLTSGTVYKIKKQDISGTTFSKLTFDDGKGVAIKGSDQVGVANKMWFMYAADATGPSSITLCATGKGSSARSAAFVAGLMAYAMLM